MHAESCTVVRFVGRIPSHWAASQAALNLQEAVAAVLRGKDGADRARVLGRPMIGNGNGSQPYSVAFKVVLRPETCQALRDGRQHETGWLPLPAPWGGQVALFEGDAAEQLQRVLLFGWPPHLDVSLLQQLLGRYGVPVTALQPLVDQPTGWDRADAVSATVPVGTRFPAGGITLRSPDGSDLATISVHRLSILPPPPGASAVASGGVSYATAAAAGGLPAPATAPGGVPAGRRPMPDSAGDRTPAAATGGRQPAPSGVRGQGPGGRQQQPQQQRTAGGSQQSAPTREQRAPPGGKRRSGSPPRAAAGAGSSGAGTGNDGGGAGSASGGRGRRARSASPSLCGGAEHGGRVAIPSAPHKLQCVLPLPAGIPTTPNTFDHLPDTDDMDADTPPQQQQQRQQQGAAAAGTALTDGGSGSSDA